MSSFIYFPFCKMKACDVMYFWMVYDFPWLENMLYNLSASIVNQPLLDIRKTNENDVQVYLYTCLT